MSFKSTKFVVVCHTVNKDLVYFQYIFTISTPRPDKIFFKHTICSHSSHFQKHFKFSQQKISIDLPQCPYVKFVDCIGDGATQPGGSLSLSFQYLVQRSGSVDLQSRTEKSKLVPATELQWAPTFKQGRFLNHEACTLTILPPRTQCSLREVGSPICQPVHLFPINPISYLPTRQCVSVTPLAQPKSLLTYCSCHSTNCSWFLHPPLFSPYIGGPLHQVF